MFQQKSLIFCVSWWVSVKLDVSVVDWYPCVKYRTVSVGQCCIPMSQIGLCKCVKLKKNHMETMKLIHSTYGEASMS